jgi:hypothetical protein
MEAIDSTAWRKSTYSGTNGGGCVEAGVADPGVILVRDTTNRSAAVLTVSVEAWQRFTSAVSSNLYPGS